MKRRLTNAFDRMTMPQSCSDRIEQMLEMELEEKKHGRYTVRVRPEAPRSPWKVLGGAAACLGLLAATALGLYWSVGGFQSGQLSPVEPTVATQEWEESQPAAETTSVYQEAEIFTSGDYVYSENGDGTATIVKYLGTEEDLTVQSYVDGKMVRVIRGAFADNERLRSVTIPDGVDLLDDNAFAGCPNLETVIIPASVTGLGHCAFDDCPNLQTVYFHGDAPATGNYVFTASEKLTIYYREGTEGWTDPWYGCNTQSVETIPQSGVEQNIVTAAFIGVLKENKTFYAHDYEENLSIAEYCTAYAETCGASTAVNKFAALDMDGDGVYEVILSIAVNEDTQSYVVLRYQEGEVHGYLLYFRQMYDLKQDGTFTNSASSANMLEFIGGKLGIREIESTQQQQDAKVPAQWFVYPCERAASVLDSYENANPNPESTATYLDYYEQFYGLVLGNHTSSWDLLCKSMEMEGYDWNLSEGILTVYFPEVPGCMLYAYPAENDRVGELGFYYCTQDKEYEAKVTDLATDAPRYFIDVDWWGEGTEVGSLEELDTYMRQKADDLEYLAVQTVSEHFSNAYFSGDAQRMRELLTDDFSGPLVVYSGIWEYQVVSIKGIPEEAREVGDVVTVWVEFRESPQADSYTYLAIELVKETLDWKVQSYGLEK